MAVKAIYCFLIIIFPCMSGFSQGENKQWFFGNGAGINFNTSPPSVQAVSNINSFETGNTICDEYGNLLFYTDGTRVYDRTHNIMPNGGDLYGDVSTTGGTSIVRAPSDHSIFYLITPEALTSTAFSTNGDPTCDFYYSKIDMTLNGGLGDVETSEKNVKLFSNTVEKSGAGASAIGCFNWFFGSSDDGKLYAYKVDSDGLQGPYISDKLLTTTNWGLGGDIYLSPDSKTLAVSYHGGLKNGNPSLELYAFDETTGLCSDPFLSWVTTNNIYFAAFSPDSRFLYLSGYSGENAILQLDLLDPDPLSNVILIADQNGDPNIDFRYLSTGPDEKIYIADLNGNALHRINNPELPGAACNFEYDAFVPLGDIQYGLQNAIAVIPKPDFEIQSPPENCEFGLKTFSITPKDIYTDSSIPFNWTLTTLSNDTLDQKSAFTYTYNFDSTGPYILSVEVANRCGYLSEKQVQFDISAIDLNLGKDSLLCNFEPFTLYANDGFDTYTWQNGTTGPGINIDAPGNYRLEVSKNGCTASDEISINEDIISIESIQITHPVCEFNSDGQIQINAGSSISSVNFSWSHDATNKSKQSNNLTPGIYSVSINNQSGCLVDTALIINPGSIIDISSELFPVDCHGEKSGKIKVNPSGGLPPYFFSWSHNLSLNQNTADQLTAGSYSVTIQDILGCSVDSLFKLEEPDPMIPSSSIIQPACSEDSNGSIEVSVIGGIAPYTYTWKHDLSLNENRADQLPVGMYSLTITDSKNCSTDLNEILAVDPFKLSAKIDTPYCDLKNGSITLNYSGNQGMTDVFWEPPHSGDTWIGLENGQYNITVTDEKNCRDSLTIILNGPSAPVVSIFEYQDASCNGICNGLIVLNPTNSGVSYSWSNGSTEKNLENICAGSYSCTVTNPSGCSATLSKTLVNLEEFDLHLNFEQPLCYGDQVEIYTSAINKINYTTVLSNMGWSGWNESAIVTQNGIYQLTLLDDDGCMITDSITLVYPEPLMFSDMNIIHPECPESANGMINIEVDGGIPPISYFWNGASIQGPPLLENLGEGEYQLTVTDNHGCFIDTLFQLKPLKIPELQFSSQDVTCHGFQDGMITISHNLSEPIAINWSDVPTAGLSRNQLSPGFYCISISNNNGCQLDSCIQITEPLPIQINLQSKDPLCYQSEDGEISWEVENVSGNVNATLNGNVVTASPIVELEDGEYCLKVWDDNQCSATTCTTLKGPPEISIDLIPKNPICNGTLDGMVTCAPITYPRQLNYLWSTGAANDTIKNLNIGNYCLTISDSLGCFAMDCIQLFQNDPINVNADIQHNPCPGDQKGSIQLTVGGGQAPYSYWASGSGNWTGNTYNSLGKGSYTVTITDVNGCTFADQYTVEATDSMDIIVNKTPLTCSDAKDAAINIFTSGGSFPYTYNWSDFPGNNSNIISGLEAGLYTVEIKDANGCSQEHSFTIDTLQALHMVPTLRHPICSNSADGSILISADGGTPPYNLSWDDGSTGFDRNGLNHGTYRTTLTDANNCTSYDTYELIRPEAIILNAGPDIIINMFSDANIHYTISPKNYPIQLLVEPYCVIQQLPHELNLRPLNDTRIILTAQDPSGYCSVADTVFIHVIKPDRLLFPNAISPNGDGINDYFPIFSTSNIHLNSINIFNRWGELIHYGNQFWEGQNEGINCPIGTYMFHIRAKNAATGQDYNVSGNVTLLR